MGYSQLGGGLLIATSATCAFVWQEWDDIYIVYQPSSAETHVFNETTALILKCLEHGPLSADEVKVQTEAALSVVQVSWPATISLSPR